MSFVRESSCVCRRRLRLAPSCRQARWASTFRIRTRSCAIRPSQSSPSGCQSRSTSRTRTTCASGRRCSTASGCQTRFQFSASWPIGWPASSMHAQVNCRCVRLHAYVCGHSAFVPCASACRACSQILCLCLSAVLCYARPRLCPTTWSAQRAPESQALCVCAPFHPIRVAGSARLWPPSV